MLSRRDQILVVKIGCGQGIQKCQIAARAFVEARDFFTRLARLRRHEFLPPVMAAVDDSECAKARRCAFVVQPLEHLLKMPVYRERLGLIDNSEPGAAMDDPYCPASPVSVSSATIDACDRIQLLART